MTNTPAPVARVTELMSGYPGPWFLAGGWAVDAWLGRESREHKDVDVAVFEDDRGAVFEHLPGWELFCHDAELPDDDEPWDGRRMTLPAHVHARREDDIDLEFIFNARAEDDQILSPEPRLTMPVTSYAGTCDWGLPALRPEVLLFFKAIGDHGLRPHDELDFRTLLPLLDARQRAWLRGAINLVAPRHSWLAHLKP